MEKKCPLCAENVKQEAKKCKFCGHTFSISKLHIFMILAVVAIFGYLQLTASKLKSSYVFKEFDPVSSGLSVQNYEVVQKKPVLKIIGTVKNNGTDTWRYINVEAKFFDKNKKLVDLTTESIPLLKPGETEDFKIDNCCGGKENPLEFDQVVVRVRGASYVQKSEE